MTAVANVNIIQNTSNEKKRTKLSKLDKNTDLKAKKSIQFS